MIKKKKKEIENLLSYRGIYRKPVTNIVHNGETELLPLRTGTRQGYLFSSLLFNIVLQVLAGAIKPGKK